MKRTSTYVLRTIQGISFLIAVRKNKYGMAFFQLNEVGAFIWENLESEINLDILVLRLKENFSTISYDATKLFVEKLVQMDIIEECANDLHNSTI